MTGIEEMMGVGLKVVYKIGSVWQLVQIKKGHKWHNTFLHFILKTY